MQETWVQSLGQEDSLEKGMATHSSTPPWREQWTEEPGRLQSVGSQRVGQDWAADTFTLFHNWRFKSPWYLKRKFSTCTMLPYTFYMQSSDGSGNFSWFFISSCLSSLLLGGLLLNLEMCLFILRLGCIFCQNLVFASILDFPPPPHRVHSLKPVLP